jgi:hypothetical protein
MTGIPDYIKDRIRKPPPSGAPVVPWSTPVVAFGNVRESTVATLSWNPSKLEFLGRDGNELVGDERRLETLTSLGVTDLASASDDAVCRVFDACNNYFHSHPYHWFNKLERILKHVNASYCNGSACHLDLVQWATDRSWSRLHHDEQDTLIKADVCFLKAQLCNEKLRLLLLNGTGIRREYEKWLGGKLEESPLPRVKRPLTLFTGRAACGLKVVGWNLNLQTNRASNKEIEVIGAAVAKAEQET